MELFRGFFRILRFGFRTLPRTQICCFPIHCHPDPRSAARMIVKNEFLEWPRAELTIGAELKCYRCHPIGLTRSVDSKSVRFTLRDAHHGVEKRRGEKKQCTENQRQ